MRSYDQILASIYEAPWFITQESLEQICKIMDRKIAGENISEDQLALILRDKKPVEELALPEKPSIAVLNIQGSMFPKANLMTQLSGATSTEKLSSDFQKLVESDMVTGILLNIDSPGGTATGIPEFAQVIHDAKGKKPIYAFANAQAASGGYYIGSQADKFYATKSGEVGSIGVIAMHIDASAIDKQAGINRTILTAGEFKAEGNPYQPLSDEAKTHKLEQMNELYTEFVNDVSRGRGVDSQTVLDTFGKGRVYKVRSALQKGMIDGIRTFDAVVSELTDASQKPVTVSVTGTGGIPSSTSVTRTGTESTIVLNFGEHMGAIPYAKTAVVDKPWDGPGAVAACMAKSGPLRKLHAWVDSSKDANNKDSYKLPHHEVSGGNPGPANIRGVRNALARLPQSSIPQSDWGGIRAHLNGHMRDFKGSSSKEGAIVMDLTSETLAALGLTEEATAEEIEFAVVALTETLKNTPEATVGTVQLNMENLPAEVRELLTTQQAQISSLQETEKKNNASMFANSFEKFTGENAKTGFGLSAVTRDLVEELHIKIADGKMTHSDLKSLMTMIATDTAVVDYRELGSNRGEEPVDASNGQESANKLRDLAYAKSAEDGLSYGDALALVMDENPALRDAYLKLTQSNRGDS